MRDNDGVLILTEAFRPNVGGVETFLDHLIHYLGKRGHKAYVLTYQPLTSQLRGRSREETSHLEVRRISWFANGWRPRLETIPPLLFLYIFPGLFIAGLSFMLRNSRRVGVIHAQSIITAIIGVILGRLFDKKVILTPHTIFRLEEKRSLAALLRPFLSRVDTHLVIAPGAKAELIASGVAPQTIEVFTHWVDLSVFRPLDRQQCRRQLGLPDGFIFLFVGRFHPQKNVTLLLQAAEVLRDEEVTFVFVGDGILNGEIRRAAANNSRIVVLGAKSNDQLSPVYSAADLYWGDLDVDYLSRVTIEAFACGTPTLAPKRINILGVTRDVKVDVFAEALQAGILQLVDPTPEAVAVAIQQRTKTLDAGRLMGQSRRYAERYHSEQNAEIFELAYGDKA